MTDKKLLNGEPPKTRHPKLGNFIKEYVKQHGDYRQSAILKAYNQMRRSQNQNECSGATISRKMNELAGKNGYQEYYSELVEEGIRNSEHKLVDQGMLGFYPDVKLTLVETKEYLAEQVAEGIKKNCKESVSFSAASKNYVLVASRDDEAKKNLCDYLEERLCKRSAIV